MIHTTTINAQIPKIGTLGYVNNSEFQLSGINRTTQIITITTAHVMGGNNNMPMENKIKLTFDEWTLKVNSGYIKF